jgi:hypothetical protein
MDSGPRAKKTEFFPDVNQQKKIDQEMQIEKTANTNEAILLKLAPNTTTIAGTEH